MSRYGRRGPQSAQVVLSDPAVDVAVLETARGGIVRRGLGYDWSDIGVMTNISDDHVGQAAHLLLALLLRLAADHRLEVAHHHRKRVRPDDTADDVVRVLDRRHPVDVEQETPDRGRGPRRRAERLANDEPRGGGAAVEAEVRPVDRRQRLEEIALAQDVVVDEDVFPTLMHPSRLEQSEGSVVLRPLDDLRAMKQVEGLRLGRRGTHGGIPPPY